MASVVYNHQIPADLEEKFFSSDLEGGSRCDESGGACQYVHPESSFLHSEYQYFRNEKFPLHNEKGPAQTWTIEDNGIVICYCVYWWEGKEVTVDEWVKLKGKHG